MKAKQTAFFCKECGYESAKWMGQCPGCRQWNTFVEEPTAGSFATTKSGGAKKQGLEASKPLRLEEISTDEEDRSSTGLHELDRVLGGGLVTGSLILVGGDPGIGKSTLLLQVCRNLAVSGKKVLYVSGEESARQVKMRADRLGGFSGELLLLSETNLEKIDNTITKEMPQVVVIDSIQTMYNSELPTAAGSVGQVRECTAKLLRFAKNSGIAVLIIGHVTKDGNIAGPRLLEHMVDVVLQFEGDRSYSFRVLRALKNRFGSTNESGIFSMEASGLQEISNPAGLFLEERSNDASGSVVCACLEGNRPILVEVQALVAKTPYGMPRRTAVGFDYNRVTMLLAILERRLGMDFGAYDAYVNVVGGMRVTEPAADLAVAAALVSSYRNRPIPHGVLVMGEVGLTGEVRRIASPERRIKDAMNLGFKRFVLPMGKLSLDEPCNGIVQVKTLEEALDKVFA